MNRTPGSFLALAAVCGWVASCATFGDGGDGGESLPNAEIGPFRELRDDELGKSHISPIALRDPIRQARDVCVLDADGDPATAPSFAYAAIVALDEKKAEPDQPTDRIARYASDDGRTFAKEGEEVLAPSQAWEAPTLGGPHTVRRDGEVWLYYASGGAIGLAVSPDGVAFVSRPEPVVRPWAQGTSLSSPSLVELPDGSWKMFLTVSTSGSSTLASVDSADGLVWSSPGEPVNVPTGVLAGAPLLSSSVFTATSPTGRDVIHLYVAAQVGAAGDVAPAIHLLSRFLDEPNWDAARAPVFAPRLGASEPFVLPAIGADGEPVTLLFASGPLGRNNDDWGITAAVAPGTAVLSPPTDRDADEENPAE